MENLYKAPGSHVSDLTLAKTPAALHQVVNLIKLAFLLSVAQFIVGVAIDPEVLSLDGELSIIFVSTLVAVMLLFWFIVYYLCMLRPVKKCKRRAAFWVFWTASFLAALSIYMEFFSGDPDFQASLVENALVLIELLVLFFAAYLLIRPEYKKHLTN